MRGPTDRAALATVLVAVGVAGVALVLEVLGHGSRACAIGFSAVGVAAGSACLVVWARGVRNDRRRLPLLLMGLVLPAFAAFALASVVDGDPWRAVLDAAGIGGVGLAVLAIYRRRP